jgi:NAD(P)-dependent dehydrogenase (short-subunit alcohol dehydrogenase family)
VTVPGDIRDEALCMAIVQRAVAELGGVDILVNNAAYQMMVPGGITEISTEQFDRVMKTNLYAMFWLSRAVVPHMAPGSSIINTASIQAYLSSSALLDYATTKGGHRGVHQGARRGPRRQGHPGQRGRARADLDPADPVDDDLEKVESFGSDTPLGRAGQPAEVAPAYVYFASDDASYTTGEVLGDTGGKPGQLIWPDTQFQAVMTHSVCCRSAMPTPARNRAVTRWEPRAERRPRPMARSST